VREAEGSSGFARTRWEAPQYRWEETAGGIQRQVPHGLDNDACDAWRMFFSNWGPAPEKQTTQEKARRQVEEAHPDLMDVSIEKRVDAAAAAAAMATREMLEEKAVRQLEAKRSGFGRKGAAPGHPLASRLGTRRGVR
jgi:hypothetical protein